MRLSVIAVGLVALALTLTGCSREIDGGAVGATKVPGSSDIWRFCDGPTLIYYTDRSGEDELEAIWPDMCVWDKDQGMWVYSTDPEEYTESDSPRVDGNVPEDE
jgi:hypothetical protein